MGKLINTTYMSLDGVVQRPELWSFDYRSDDVSAYTQELLFSADAILMGGHNYEVFAARWPNATDDLGLADRMNSLPRYVVSDTLTNPTWAGTTVVPRAGAVDAVRDAKDKHGTVVQYGFGAVTTTMLAAGLVDEIQIWLHPLLVGPTMPEDTIAATRPEKRLQLEDVRRFDSGIVLLTYTPAGDEHE